MNIIGQRLTEERVLAEPVHSSLSTRWSDILTVGLSKEEKVALIKKYPPPNNCTFLDSPQLNVGVNLAINEFCRTRDKRIMNKHEKLAAIAGVTKTISMLLSRESTEDITIIECLSDVCRLITDAMHGETSIRRCLILTNVSSSIKEILNKAPVDNFLFGKKLSEELKAAKIIEQSAEDLKLKKTTQYKSSGPKNWRGPPRQQPKAPSMTAGGHQSQMGATTSRSQHTRYPDY